MLGPRRWRAAICLLLLPLWRAGDAASASPARLRVERWQRVSLQGNLDPAALLAPPPEIERRVAELIEQGRKARGHIVNLGHGIQPQTPVEGVAAFVRAVQSA